MTIEQYLFREPLTVSRGNYIEQVDTAIRNRKAVIKKLSARRYDRSRAVMPHRLMLEVFPDGTGIITFTPSTASPKQTTEPIRIPADHDAYYVSQVVPGTPNVNIYEVYQYRPGPSPQLITPERRSQGKRKKRKRR